MICVISPVHMVINSKLGVMNSKQRRSIRFRNKTLKQGGTTSEN